MFVFKDINVLIPRLVLVLIVLGAGVTHLSAQSEDARTPSPIHTNEVVGRIGARDLGDSRLTNHFYAFSGTPGDVLITIETRNLNGDIDVFTAGSLRPVFKISLYAELTTPVTKTIYLRSREDLILRIEARTPNDDDGAYHLSFAGSFAPVAAAANEEAKEIAALPAAARKGKRVSSVGARIEAAAPPPLEVAETRAPEPAAPDLVDPPPAEPRAAVVATPKEAEVEGVVPPTSPSRSERARAGTRRGRNRGTTAEAATKKPVSEETTKEVVRREEEGKRGAATEISETPAAPAKKSSKKSRPVTAERAADESATSESTPVEEVAPAAGTSRRAKARSKRAPAASAAKENAPSAQPEDLSKSKLVIEMLDGTRLERFMNTVRRVDVENGEIVVTSLDGTVQRIRLARVARMSIGP